MFLLPMQAIINENDLDANGCLSFDEFLVSMAANIKVLSEEEHRCLYRRSTSVEVYVSDFRRVFLCLFNTINCS